MATPIDEKYAFLSIYPTTNFSPRSQGRHTLRSIYIYKHSITGGAYSLRKQCCEMNIFFNSTLNEVRKRGYQQHKTRHRCWLVFPSSPFKRTVPFAHTVKTRLLHITSKTVYSSGYKRMHKYVLFCVYHKPYKQHPQASPVYRSIRPSVRFFFVTMRFRIISFFHDRRIIHFCSYHLTPIVLKPCWNVEKKKNPR